MQNRQAIDAQQLLQAFQQHMRAHTDDGEVFCELGPLLRSAGKPHEAKQCYKRAVEIIRSAARRGDADTALHIEQGVYINFVRSVETEEHYYRCFADWREDLARLGRRLRDPRGWPEADPKRIAFVLVTGFRLAHAEVMLRTVSAQAGSSKRGLEATVYVIGECSAEFAAKCGALGVRLVAPVLDDPTYEKAGLGAKMLALRDRLRADRIGCAVWVSMPAGAAFALSMGLAPVQVFWALRFHPIAALYIDGYLTYGAPGERERVFGKQAWRVVPTPLAVDMPQLDPAKIREVRERYPEPMLFGTVAREDKIRSPEFLKAVAAILKTVPSAGYVWTGREQDREIGEYFVAQGVAARCHYAGWVDAPLYGSAFDAFLETFPLGCGVTGYQALASGTPLLSYLAENTVFGMQYWSEVKASLAAGAALELSGYPVLCAGSLEEYVRLAQKLAADPSFRAAVGRRGKDYCAQEVTMGASYADDFFSALEEAVAAKRVRAA